MDKFNVRANAATGGHHEQGRSRLRHPIRVHVWRRLRVAGVGTAARRAGAELGGASQAAGAGSRPVRDRPARLFLRRRKIHRRTRQGHHAGSGLRRGARPEGCPAALSARAHPWRGADRDQLDGNAGWAQRLGRVFRRAGLRRLHDRPADAWPLRLASRRRRNAHVHRPAGGIPVYRQSRSGEPGRRRRSTPSGRATARTRGRRGIRSSMRSTPRRWRP